MPGTVQIAYEALVPSDWVFEGSFFAGTRKMYDYVMQSADERTPPPYPHDPELQAVYIAQVVALHEETDWYNFNVLVAVPVDDK
jgi:hypothetical protein